MSRKARRAIKRQKITHRAYQDRMMDLTQDVEDLNVMRRSHRRIRRMERG